MANGTHYTVTIIEDGKAERVYNEVGGTTVVPSTPPLLIINNRKGQQMAIEPMPGYVRIQYDPVETPEILQGMVVPAEPFKTRH